jgi:hypothetical protein
MWEPRRLTTPCASTACYRFCRLWLRVAELHICFCWLFDSFLRGFGLSPNYRALDLGIPYSSTYDIASFVMLPWYRFWRTRTSRHPSEHGRSACPKWYGHCGLEFCPERFVIHSDRKDELKCVRDANEVTSRGIEQICPRKERNASLFSFFS